MSKIGCRLLVLRCSLEQFMSNSMKCLPNSLAFFAPIRARRSALSILLVCLTLGFSLIGHYEHAVADDTGDLIESYVQSYDQLKEAIETIKKADSTTDPDYVDALHTYKQLTRALPDIKQDIEDAGGKVPEEYVDIPTLPGLGEKARSIDPKPGDVINAEGENAKVPVVAPEQRRPWKLGGTLTYSAETKRRQVKFQKKILEIIRSDWASKKGNRLRKYNNSKWKKFIHEEFEKLYKDYYFVMEYEPIKERQNDGRVKECSVKQNNVSNLEKNRRLRIYGVNAKKRVKYWFQQIYLYIGEKKTQGSKTIQPKMEEFKNTLLKTISNSLSVSMSLPAKLTWTKSLDPDKSQSMLTEEYEAIQGRIGAILRQRFDRVEEWKSASDDGSTTKAGVWNESVERACRKLVEFEREIVWRLGAPRTDAEIASQERSLGAVKALAKKIEKLRMNRFESTVRSLIADAWFETAKNVSSGSDLQTSEDSKCAESMYRKFKGALKSEISNQSVLAHDHFYHNLINGLRRSGKLGKFSPHVETDKRTDNVYWYALFAEQRSINATNTEEQAMKKYREYYDKGYFKRCYSQSDTFVEFLTGEELVDYTKQQKARRAVLQRKFKTD